MDADHLKLAGSLANAEAGLAADITAVGSGTHIISAAGPAQSFLPADIDIVTNNVTIAAHGFSTGDKLIYSTNGTPATGLTRGETYYAIKAGPNTIKLADSYAGALSGTAIDLTTIGSGEHELTKVSAPADSAEAKIFGGGGSAQQIQITLPDVQSDVESWDLTCVGAAVMTPGAAMTLYDDDNNAYRIWYSIGGGGSDPGGIGSPVPVAIGVADTAEDVALATWNALPAALQSRTTVNTDTISFIAQQAEDLNDPSTDTTGFSISLPPGNQGYNSHLSDSYFTFNTKAQGYYVWFSEFYHAGSDPGLPGRTGIHVDLSASSLMNPVSLAWDAIKDVPGLTAGFNDAANTLIITNDDVWDVPEPMTGGSGLSATTLVSGGRADVNAGTNQITIAGHGFTTGLEVQLVAASGTVPSGLTNLASYYIIRDDNDTVRLSSSRAEALEGTALDITDAGLGIFQLIPRGTGRGGGEASVGPADINTADDLITVTGRGYSYSTGQGAYTQGQAVQVFSTGALPGGLARDTTYYVIAQDADHIQLAASAANAAAGVALNLTDAGSGSITIKGITETKSFIGDIGGNVNIAADTLSLGANTFRSGDRVRVTGLGLPTGLQTDTDYYVIKGVNPGDVSLASSLVNAEAGVAINLSDLGSADPKTIALSAPLLSSPQQDTAVDPATNLIAIAGHTYQTGDQVLLVKPTTSTLAGGLTDQTNYYIYRADANHIGLATTLDNALSATLVDLTSTGTGEVYLDLVLADPLRPDLALPQTVPAGTPTLMLNRGNGDGTFQAAVALAPDFGSSSVILQDIDGDSTLDLLALSSSRDAVGVAIGNGDGTFLAVTSYALGTVSNSLAVADFTADGLLDIVATDENNSKFRLLTGAGSGTFDAAVSLDIDSGAARAIFAGDIDGDAKQDIAVTNDLGVSVRFGNGNGTFTAPISYAMGTSPTATTFADLNRDGFLDLTSVDRAGSTVYTRAATTYSATIVTQKVASGGSNTDPLSHNIRDQGQALVSLKTLKKLRDELESELKALTGIDEALRDAAAFALAGYNASRAEGKKILTAGQAESLADSLASEIRSGLPVGMDKMHANLDTRLARELLLE